MLAESRQQAARKLRESCQQAEQSCDVIPTETGRRQVGTIGSRESRVKSRFLFFFGFWFLCIIGTLAIRAT